MKPLAADDPRVIGEYRLRARLGAGGMGRVYLGLSPGGRAGAIKVVHPDLANDGEFLRRIHQLLLGADGFYEDVFASLRIPYEPVRWSPDIPDTYAFDPTP